MCVCVCVWLGLGNRLMRTVVLMHSLHFEYHGIIHKENDSYLLGNRSFASNEQRIGDSISH